MITVVENVCFTPDSGRAARSLKKSAKCQQRTWINPKLSASIPSRRQLSERSCSNTRIGKTSGVPFTPASNMLSVALCHNQTSKMKIALNRSAALKKVAHSEGSL